MVSLYYVHGLVVKGRAYAAGGLNVVVALEELVEVLEACAEVVNADRAVLVEVQAQVVVLHEHLDVRVGPTHVVHQLILAFDKYTDQHTDEVRGIVVEEHHSL